MRVVREPDGARLELDDHEIALLQSVMTSVDELTDGSETDDPDDPVLRRLNPDAYPGDREATEEFRELTATSLRALRSDRFAACRDDLDAGSPVDLGDDEVGTRWIQMLNDLRLTIGTRLEVTEEPPDIDPDAPEAGMWVLYSWLSEVQESVVLSLMEP